MKKILAAVVCAACFATAAAQAQEAGSPEALVRGFYEWYVGSLDREDYGALKRRREALRYLTPEFHQRAPRVIAREMVDIFVCTQDWQRGWGDRLDLAPGPVRGSRAQVTAAFDYGPENRARVRLTLRRAAGRWRIEDAECTPGS